MDEKNCSVACNIVSKSYVDLGCQALARRTKLIKTLLSQQRLPLKGWDEATIELFLNNIALMDSNNFLDKVGMGEREGRVANGLVLHRHFRLSHGIGRSGELSAEQPKAAGSSLLMKLTNCLVRDSLRIAGLLDVGLVLTVPLATGMTITMTLLAIRNLNPKARYVIWPRVDQKTCLKCIIAAGFQPEVISMKLMGDQLVTDVEAIDKAVSRLGVDAIACVLTTTSCFAPRAPDDVVAVGKLCRQLNVAHVINNAYGIQSAAISSLITSAWRKGRVDAVISSTDKNYMVPVGGAIVYAPQSRTELVEQVDKLYPGRASMSPLLDLSITLLHLGVSGWEKALVKRENLYKIALNSLKSCSNVLGERVLAVSENPISMAMTVDSLSGSKKGATFLGSMLFSRSAFGARVIIQGKRQEVSGIHFDGYGASYDEYPHAYITVAAAIGMDNDEIDDFIQRLLSCIREIKGDSAESSDKTS